MRYFYLSLFSRFSEMASTEFRLTNLAESLSPADFLHELLLTVALFSLLKYTELHEITVICKNIFMTSSKKIESNYLLFSLFLSSTDFASSRLSLLVSCGLLQPSSSDKSLGRRVGYFLEEKDFYRFCVRERRFYFYSSS